VVEVHAPEVVDLRTLGYVVAMFEEGSLGAAARRLNLTQPTLSRQLRELERRVGAELFVREARGMLATPVGRTLYRRAVALLAEAQSAMDELQLAVRGMSGSLTLAFSGAGINGPLGRILRPLRRELHDVDLQLVEVFDDVEMSEGVATETYDVAVHRLPSHDKRIETHVWTREPLCLFLPTSHRMASTRSPIALTQLDEVPLVLWARDASPRSYDEVLALCRRAGVHVRIESQGARSAQAILALVAAGVGAAVMADSYHVLRREGVTSRPIIGAETTLYMSWRVEDPNPVLRRFLAVVQASQPLLDLGNKPAASQSRTGRPEGDRPQV
jgi:DNA-binding transcriptional LysR family regulator